MKWNLREARLDGVLEEYAITHLDWPDSAEELDRFLGEDTSKDASTDAEIVARVARVLGHSRKDEGSSGPQQSGGQGTLFPLQAFQDQDNDGEVFGTSHTAGMYEIIRQAYKRVARDYSTDRVIADPERNALFVQACWSLGAVASQCELNLTLLNARKAGHIGKIEGVQRYQIPRAVMDQYLFASEFALRCLEEEEYFQQQQTVSLDRILCDPELGRRFVDIARTIVPGFTAFDYRWAALTIRKATNRRAPQAQLPELSFDRLGRRDSIQTSRIANVPGFFWMKSHDADVYIGHAENIREMVERTLDLHMDWARERTPWLDCGDFRRVEYAIALSPGLSASNREPLKTSLVRKQEPKLNFVANRVRVA